MGGGDSQQFPWVAGSATGIGSMPGTDPAEACRVVLASVTEGDDKPLKYPHMFRRADLVLVSKTDLLPYVDFDSRRHAADVRKTSPDTLMLQVSAATGAGMQEWYDWLRRRILPPED